MTDYAAWHYYLDALPRVVGEADGPLALHLLIGTAGAPGEGANQTVTVEWESRSLGQEWVGHDSITAVPVSQAKYKPFKGGPPATVGDRPDRSYLLAGQLAGWFGNVYYEAVIGNLAPNTEVRYQITATPDAGEPRPLGWFRVVVAEPDFRSADLAASRASDDHSERCWIAYQRTADGFTHLRVDLDDLPGGAVTDNPPIPVRFQVKGDWIDINPVTIRRAAEKDQAAQVPLLDWALDRITLSVPEPREPVLVDAFEEVVSLGPGQTPGCARVMFAHFAIQGLNDLLEVPFAKEAGDVKSYSPPRTYMQVTMDDSLGLFRSGPNPDKGRDGYSFGFATHRRFNVPYDLALNGGLMTLLAHDCRPDRGWTGDSLATMREDIDRGLLHPGLAGYGSYRMPYYAAGVNQAEIELCAELQKTLLGTAGTLLMPDSRLYRQTAAEVPVVESDAIRYLVVDSLTGYRYNQDSIHAGPELPGGAKLGSFRLWQDETTGKYVVFIDDDLKELMARPREWDWDTPKPDLELRRRLLGFAIDPKLNQRNLLCYGDDFEKACGNGWFEGYRTAPGFSASVEWMSGNRPWLRFVTSADLDEKDCAGTIDLTEAIDPGEGRTEGDKGKDDLFDAWLKRWRDYPAEWLGTTLGALTDAVQAALTSWPTEYDNDLSRIAWRAFLMGQHENAWNKMPESGDLDAAHTKDPEDFAVVEGLQVRNVLVWLKAAVWAWWATHDPQAASLPDLIRALPVRDADPIRVNDPDHWDADPMPTHVLFNPEALVVLDQNGGRCTHAFVIDAGRPRAVSGTFKSYQYRDRNFGDVDGPALQNTVWTANHRYIGSEIGLAQGPTTVDWPNDRGDHGRETLTLPDNFNAYTTTVPANRSDRVTFTYEPSEPPPGTQIDQDTLVGLLRQDGNARRSDTPGDMVVWHGRGTPFSKTFTLNGTTLTVSYDGLPIDTIVDNEVSVDLLAGLTGDAFLTREHDADDLVIRCSTGGAVRFHSPSGGTFTQASLFRSWQDAHDAPVDQGQKNDTLIQEFDALNRVLTAAVQIVATAPTLSYDVALKA